MKTLFQSRRLSRHAIFGQIQVPPLLPLSSSNGELFRVCVIGKSSCHHLLPIWFCRNRFVACSSVSHHRAPTKWRKRNSVLFYNWNRLQHAEFGDAQHMRHFHLETLLFLKLMKDTVFMKGKVYHFSGIWYIFSNQ